MTTAGENGSSPDYMDMTSIRQLLARLMRSHRRGSLITLILSLSAAATEGLGILLLVPLLALLGIGRVGEPVARTSFPWIDYAGKSLYVMLALFLLVLAMRQLIVFLQRRHIMALRISFSQELRLDLFSAIANAEWRYLSAGTLHRQMQILLHDSHRAGDAVQGCFSLAAASLLTLVQLAIAAALSPAITTVAILCAALASMGLRRELHRARSLGRELSEHNDALYRSAANFLPMLRTARLRGKTHALTDRFRRDTQRINETVLTYISRHTASVALIHLSAGLFLVGGIAASVRLFPLGAVQLSVLVLIFARLTPVFANAFQLIQKLAHDLPAFENAQTNISVWSSRADDMANELASVPIPERTISLVDICGGYTHEGRNELLQNISCEIAMSRITVLTGPTGAGKSTLADIVAGLHPPKSGHLSLDGVPLAPDQFSAWRACVGYVDQRATLFAGTLEENLIWSLEKPSESWFRTVLDTALVSQFLDQLPDGLQTLLGEHGSPLSGGQIQRVAIARELLRRPRLLILDEATSGLDEATEARLLHLIASLADTPTILLISHRRSARRFADQILVMEDGRLVQPDGSMSPARRIGSTEADDAHPASVTR